MSGKEAISGWPLKRVLYADLFRIAACFFVMLIHITGGSLVEAPYGSTERWIYSIYYGLSAFAVPGFVMLSGMFLLNEAREITIKRIYTKYIRRIILAFIFWSAFYAGVYFIFKTIENGGIRREVVTQAGWDFLTGYYHMWFLFLIIGLYMITPFLRRLLCGNAELKKYFLLLSFLFTFLFPWLVKIPALAFLGVWLKNMNYFFTLGYVFYFVIGGGDLDKLSETKRLVIYALGIFGYLFGLYQGNATAGNLMEKETGNALPGALSLTGLFVTIAVFVFFKYEVSRIKFKATTAEKITRLSRYTFTMFLVHAIWIELLGKVGITVRSFTPVISVPLLTALVFILSGISAWFLAKISFYRKYVI